MNQHIALTTLVVKDYKLFTSNGVQFVNGEPRVEVYGTVVVFADLYGNLWDLIQPSS